VCAGSSYFVYDRYSSFVGLYEYRSPNEISPVSFQYAGPALFRDFNQRPVLAIFTVVICNQANDVPVNLHVRPSSLAWAANGQALVSRSHDCTSLDEHILSARDGDVLTCSYTANGISYTCGSVKNLVPPHEVQSHNIRGCAHLLHWHNNTRLSGHQHERVDQMANQELLSAMYKYLGMSAQCAGAFLYVRLFVCAAGNKFL